MNGHFLRVIQYTELYGTQRTGVGWFGGMHLGNGLLTGTSLEAYEESGIARIRPMSRYVQRYHAHEIGYSTLGYVYWQQAHDTPDMQFGICSEDTCRIPCLHEAAIRTHDSVRDPEYCTLTRHILTVRAVLQDGVPALIWDTEEEA